MASVETKLIISGNAAGAKKAFDEVANKIKSTQNNVSSFLQAHKIALTAVTAGVAAGMAMMAIGIKKATSAAMEQEVAETKLKGALLATGTYTAKLEKSWIDYADKLQRTTTYQDENIISAMGMIQQFAKLNDGEMKRIIPSVLDLSTALGIDLDTASKLVGKTLSGSINAFKRYGIEVDMAGTSSDRLASLTDALNVKFGGQAELMRGTFTGALQGVKIAYGEIWEAAGQAITQNTSTIASMAALEKLFWNIQEVVTKNQVGIRGLAQKGINVLIQGIWLAVRAVLGLRMAWVECQTAFWKFQSFVVDKLADIVEAAFKVTTAIDFKGQFRAQRAEIWNMRNDLKMLAEQSSDEAKEKWEDVKKLGQIWIDLEKSVEQYGKAVGKIPLKGEIIKKDVKSISGGSIDITEPAAAGKIESEAKESQDKRLKLLERFAVAQKRIAEKTAKEIEEIEQIEAEARQQRIDNLTAKWVNFNESFVAVGEQAIRTSRTQHESFFTAFGKGLAMMIKQYIRAMIMEVAARKITEITKAAAAAPLTMGATLAAIAPIVIASAAGVAALEALIPQMAAGGIVSKPTLIMAGEAGPEAIVPLGKGYGGTNYYTFYISEKVDLVQVTDAIRRGNPAAINFVKAINRTGSLVAGEA